MLEGCELNAGALQQSNDGSEYNSSTKVYQKKRIKKNLQKKTDKKDEVHETKPIEDQRNKKETKKSMVHKQHGGAKIQIMAFCLFQYWGN